MDKLLDLALEYIIVDLLLISVLATYFLMKFVINSKWTNKQKTLADLAFSLIIGAMYVVFSEPAPAFSHVLITTFVSVIGYIVLVRNVLKKFGLDYKDSDPSVLIKK